MILSLIQTTGNCQKPETFKELQKSILKATEAGAQVIALPELFLNPYFCQQKKSEPFELATTLEDPLLKAIQQLSEQTKTVLIVPFFERTPQGEFYNSCALFESGILKGTYHKNHIPDDPGFHEKYYFKEGETGYQVFDTAFGKIGILICFDQWFPEAARATALKGCDVIIIPTAIGWDKREFTGLDDQKIQSLKAEQLDAWVTVQRGHAISNGCYVAAVNRIGQEDDLIFWGNSFVSGPFGRVLKQLDSLAQETLTVKCDFQESHNIRKVWTFHRDRRPDTYSDLTKPKSTK